MSQLGGGLRLSPQGLHGNKALEVKHLFPREHVVHRTAQLVGEDSERLGFTVFAFEFGKVRFPRVQDFVSYCRLVKCAKESNGKRLGTSGKKIGNVHLRWAFAEAAVLFIRQSKPGKEYFAKLEHKHGKAKALTVLAHKLGRAVYYMLTREQVFDLKRFVTA